MTETPLKKIKRFMASPTKAIFLLIAVFFAIAIGVPAFLGFYVNACAKAGGQLVGFGFVMTCSVNISWGSWTWLQNDLQWAIPVILISLILILVWWRKK